ncbi:MAG: hypothetical protein JXQ99_27010 [Hyphomicrobiaceae bacterium]
MSVILIDPDGNELTAGWRLNELRELSGLNDASLYEYLARNMAYIVVGVGPQSLSVRLNPGIVSPPSLAAAFYRTAEFSDLNVDVEFLGRGPPENHTLANGATAIDFISRIVKLRSESASGRFFRQRAPVGQEMAHDQFRRLIEMLKRFSTPQDSEFVKAHLRRHFNGRYVVLKCDHEAGRLLLDDAGGGYTGLDSYWANDAVGKPVEKLFDKDYWSFVSEAFQETIHAGVPTLDDVDAVVRTSPGKSSALSYHRLIVPLADGRLLGVSVRHRAPIALGG